MRHVDDAHDAEGDGKADRRQQQHRAERDAVPDVLAGRPNGQRAVDAWRSPWSRRPSARRPAVASNEVSSDSASRSPRAPSTSIAASLSASARSETSTAEARACSSRALTLGIGLLGDRRVERGDRRRIGIAEHGFGGGEPHGRIGGAERQRAEHVADDAAQPVVDLDLGEVAPWPPRRPARR